MYIIIVTTESGQYIIYNINEDNCELVLRIENVENNNLPRDQKILVNGQSGSVGWIRPEMHEISKRGWDEWGSRGNDDGGGGAGWKGKRGQGEETAEKNGRKHYCTKVTGAREMYEQVNYMNAQFLSPRIISPVNERKTTDRFIM